jgi:threonine/homoserine efflux transporter RhtA
VKGSFKVGDLVRTLTREYVAPIGTYGVVTNIVKYSFYVTLIRVQLMVEPPAALEFVREDLRIISHAK